MVKAISINAENKRTQVELGDSDGEVRTLHNYSGTTDKSVLKKEAEAELDRLKTEGYRGSIEVYGEPFTSHGYVAVLQDNDFPERASENFIDKEIIDFGYNTQPAFKRTLTIGRKAL